MRGEVKIAVLADIHGNLEALDAVLADLQQQGADRIICLGDNIGYGPDPEEVVVPSAAAAGCIRCWATMNLP